MDGPTSCSSLTVEREDHMTTVRMKRLMEREVQRLYSPSVAQKKEHATTAAATSSTDLRLSTMMR
jgi:hypothetical protein